MPRSKSRYVYDCEDFPNFFSAIFKNITTQQFHAFIVFHDRDNPSRNVNEITELIDFINNQVEWLIGYNNHAYDDLLLMHILSNTRRLRGATPQKIVTEMQDLSVKCGEHMKKKARHAEIYSLKRREKPFRSLDLMMLYNTIERTSLKQLAIGLKWPKIQDLPFKPWHLVKHEDIPTIADYNINDVDITEKVMETLTEKINLRITYTKKYKTDIINSCNSDIGRKIIAAYYERESGIKYKEFSQHRTAYDKLPLVHCISPRIRFATREYQKVLERTKEVVIDPNKREDSSKKGKKQFEQIVRSKYLTHTMGLGGIHSNGPAEILTECEKYTYIDIDAKSFYPWIICNENLYPKHLGPIFTTVYKRYIVEERMRIIKEDAILAYMLKIAANATFGLTKANYDGNWLYDPHLTTFICVTGQLYLLMLVEALESQSGCVVVYSNTDGLTVRVPRQEANVFYSICKKWEQYVGFELEFVRYKRMVVRDVNSFIMFSYSKDPEKQIKAKGAYVYKKEEFKGYTYPVIAKAVQDFFEKGTPVESTIMAEKSIYEFMCSEKTSESKFDVVLYQAKDRNTGLQLQKTNRWIVTKNNPEEGKLYKVSKKDQEKTEMEKDYLVTIVNDVNESAPIETYNLLYQFYINEAISLINLTQTLDRDTHNREEYIQTELFAA